MRNKYLISDPCYVFKDEYWDEYVSKILTAEKDKDFKGLIDVGGHALFAHYTQYGDGYYSSSLPGRSFGVDSGTLGCIPLELCKREDQIRGEYYEIELRDLGAECSYEDGSFHIGHVTIDT